MENGLNILHLIPDRLLANKNSSAVYMHINVKSNYYRINQGVLYLS